MTQQKYQCDGNIPSEWSDWKQNYERDSSHCNTPSESSDNETDDKNFDDEIKVSSDERWIANNCFNKFF